MVDIKYYLEIAKDETKLAFSNNKMLLFISILLFVIPVIIGYFYANEISEYIQPMVDSFEQQVEEGTISLTTYSIFTNNVSVAFILYALAALGGVLGAVILANNGLFIGYYGVDFDILAYLVLTLPHGILEIPAIIIATTGGFVLLSFILHFIWGLISPDLSYLDIFDPYFSNVKITTKLVDSPSCLSVASSRPGKCQFAGAKIMPFCEISKSIDNYFSDLSINSYINIYYMYAREKLCA